VKIRRTVADGRPVTFYGLSQDELARVEQGEVVGEDGILICAEDLVPEEPEPEPWGDNYVLRKYLDSNPSQMRPGPWVSYARTTLEGRGWTRTDAGWTHPHLKEPGPHTLNRACEIELEG